MLDLNLDAFTFTSTDPHMTRFSAFKGKRLVIYFYPKDNTPGCTLEARDFTRLGAEFAALNTVVIGISRDSCESHDRFIQQQALSFVLISDPNDVLGKAFGVIKEKSLFAKTFLGIERSTFLFDEQGHCRQEWRKVSAKGHAETVLEAVRSLGP